MAIIPEKTKQMRMYKIILIGIILCISLFLRLYRIESRTEFLGDQGSAGVLIYNYWKNRELPLVGQAFSTGEMAGPAYLYIIAPSLILTNFNPLAPAIFFAALGICTLVVFYKVLCYFFRFEIRLLLLALYGFSPVVVMQSRSIWNPTPIPSFIAVILLGLCHIWFKKKVYWMAIIGFSCGILVQLHPTNYFTFLCTVIAIAVLFRLGKNAYNRQSIIWFSITGCMFFLLALSPFLLYELRHGLKDIFAIFDIRSRTNFSSALRPDIFMIVSRPFVYLFPFLPSLFTTAMGVLFPIAIFLLRNRTGMAFAVWYLSGVVFVAVSGVELHDHYILFLQIIPIFIIGFLFAYATKHRTRLFIYVFCIFTLLVNIRAITVRQTEHNDIERTSLLTQEMLGQSEGSPFGFTMVTSRSYSDYHYRYFFTLYGRQPNNITDQSIRMMFIICEEGECMTGDQLRISGSVQAVCWDLHCRTDYPRIILHGWHITKVTDVSGARVYTFVR